MTKRSLMPLSEFPEEKRLEIERLASQPKCPPKWLDGVSFQIESRAHYEWQKRRKRERKRVKRHRIAERDNWMCGICRELIQVEDLHIDHVIPLSLGGTSDSANLQAAHWWCNLQKGNRV